MSKSNREGKEGNHRNVQDFHKPGTCQLDCPSAHTHAGTYDPTPAGENTCVCLYICWGRGGWLEWGWRSKIPQKATFKSPLRWKLI